MSISNFQNGVSSFGVPQIGNGGEIPAGGEYWFVDSNNGSDGYEGSWDAPFATLDYAVGKCTANINSVIVLKPNHAETLIADSGVDIDVAGVQVVSLGKGADRATFTFTTSTSADFKLAANNVSISNILFVAGLDALTGPIEVSGDDCAIINCEYRDATAIETTDVIVTASTPLRMLIDGFRYVQDGGTGGTQNQSVIQLNGADGAIIRNCWLVADSGTGVIEDATTSDQILIENCTVENSEVSPTPAITFTATTTGSVRFCHLRIASGTTYVTATTDLQYYETYGTGTDNTAGEKIGTQLAGDIEAKIDVIDAYHDVATADAATNAVMSDVVGNKEDAAATGTVSTTETLMAYAKQNVTNTEKIGTIVNAGGTATIGGAFGDFANDTLVARLNDIGSDVNATTTDSIQGKIGTDTEMADRSLYDLLNGAGPVAAASAAAPANGVSIYGMIRDIWDVLRNGTGGAEPEANTSIIDILSGAAGITTWATPATYASGVSMAEVLSYVQNGVRNGTGTGLPANTSLFDMAERCVTTGTAVIANGTATAFTVAGGPIIVTHLAAVCITPNDATATTLKFTADPTDGTATDLCTASATLANATAGTIVNITGTVADAGVITAQGTAIEQAGGILVPAGVIQNITGVGATTGTWYVCMRYKPLRPGVTVTAAY